MESTMKRATIVGGSLPSFALVLATSGSEIARSLSLLSSSSDFVTLAGRHDKKRRRNSKSVDPEFMTSGQVVAFSPQLH
jgi:hypothetical protein